MLYVWFLFILAWPFATLFYIQNKDNTIPLLLDLVIKALLFIGLILLLLSPIGVVIVTLYILDEITG